MGRNHIAPLSRLEQLCHNSKLHDLATQLKLHHLSILKIGIFFGGTHLSTSLIQMSRLLGFFGQL